MLLVRFSANTIVTLFVVEFVGVCCGICLNLLLVDCGVCLNLFEFVTCLLWKSVVKSV